MRIRIVLVLLLLSVTPAFAQLSVHGRLMDDRTVRPGDRYAGSFLVRNDSNTPRDVQVLQHDYRLDSDSLATLRPPATHRRSNAGWIVVSPSRFSVAPGEARRVDYDITVPARLKGAPPAGSYRSLLSVSDLAIESTHGAFQFIADAVASPATHDVRQSVQLATHIEGTGHANLLFRGVDVHDEAGVRIMTADLENTGDVMIEPLISVELYTPAGELVERHQAMSLRLYPGDSLRHRLPLDTLNAGSYEALIVVDAGGENIFGAQYTLNVTAW
ncbi:MAG: hypothetical protein SH809_01895 [Rhodothermales bacterium]|nr:hypothetical protein [Rhodothermales bacterium]